MRFGFATFLFLFILVAFGGALAWLAFTDVPVEQQEIVVNVPIGAAQ